MRTLSELVDKEEPGWDLVKEWFKNAKNHYEILPRDDKRAEKELIKAQVTTRSPMGAVIYETGGILIDHGWIRVLGSGHPKLNRGLIEWNKGKSFKDDELPQYLLVADDVIGGYFAINAGAFGCDMGHIYYLAQDSLEWENMECGYSDFLSWVFNGDIQLFYKTFKWNTWKEDVTQINGNQVFSFFPFLWTKCDNIEERSRKPVPIEESFALVMELQQQLQKRLPID